MKHTNVLKAICIILLNETRLLGVEGFSIKPWMHAYIELENQLQNFNSEGTHPLRSG